MKHYSHYILCAATLIFLLFSSSVTAQTCSCAGAPLISSQSISTTSKGNIFMGVTYEFKEISDLYSGNQQLKNNTVERNTQSTLFEINYGITNRLTISGTLTHVQKQRLSVANDNELITRGIGDGLIMLKYVLHQNTMSEQYQLAVGGGTKIPFGKTSLAENGIPLNLDMQPGTGAWDGVAWSFFSKTFAPVSNVNFFLYNTFRATGSVERFNQDDQYKFGNEWVVNAGITDNLFSDLSYVGIISYRSTSSDQLNGNNQPNTGGKWISIEPALQYQINNNLFAKIGGNIPIYQHLNGIQPTTSYAASLSIFYNFGGKVIF